MKKDYSLFLISFRPERYSKIQESLSPELLYYFDGTGGPTFSTLVNQCAEASPTEIVIILGDKVYPKPEHVQKMVELIKMGHGIVGLYRFGFFGFKKELLRRIGMFDERFVPGGWEDQDMILRCILSNVSFYMTEEVEYHKMPSTWDNGKAGGFYLAKWYPNWNVIHHDYIPQHEKVLSEETYNYNLGPSIPTKFLTCREYTYSNTYLADFMFTKVISHVPVNYINHP